VKIMNVSAADLPGRGVRVLVSAASRHGATAEIAQAIGLALSGQGYAVTIAPPDQVRSVEDYHAVMLGSAVYAGHWLGPAKDLASRCRDSLACRPVWLFSSGPVGDPSGKLARSMAQVPVEVPRIRAALHARDHQMFAGKLDRKKLNLAQRASLLVFRGLDGDFRDWDEIADWAESVAAQLTLTAR
jgi:menaquinone-dependent protoporphyrinogen oxidase